MPWVFAAHQATGLKGRQSDADRATEIVLLLRPDRARFACASSSQGIVRSAANALG